MAILKPQLLIVPGSLIIAKLCFGRKYNTRLWL